MPTTKPMVTALLLGWAAFALAADPDEIALLETLKNMYPATQWTSVTRTPIPGVFEALMGSNIAYVGSDGRHFLFGHLFDMRTQMDLTAPRLAAGERTPSEAPDTRSKLSFAALPLADAIKTVRGNGARLLAVFSDPNCPYCKMLDAELARLDNLTLYTFVVPWISPDRTAAETAWTQAVPERTRDTAVLDRNLHLATQVGLRGTPLLIAGDGRVSEGSRPIAELEAWLNAGESQDRASHLPPTAKKIP